VQLDIPSSDTLPVPPQLGQVISPVPSHVGHSTSSATAKFKVEKTSIPISKIVHVFFVGIFTP